MQKGNTNSAERLLLGIEESNKRSIFIYLGLAISDISCLVTQIWMNVYINPAVSAAALNYFDAFGMMYLTAGIPHLTFTRVTSCITAFITLERCLCVIAPLKVGDRCFCFFFTYTLNSTFATSQVNINVIMFKIINK